MLTPKNGTGVSVRHLLPPSLMIIIIMVLTSTLLACRGGTSDTGSTGSGVTSVPAFFGQLAVDDPSAFGPTLVETPTIARTWALSPANEGAFADGATNSETATRF